MKPTLRDPLPTMIDEKIGTYSVKTYLYKNNYLNIFNKAATMVTNYTCLMSTNWEDGSAAEAEAEAAAAAAAAAAIPEADEVELRSPMFAGSSVFRNSGDMAASIESRGLKSRS